MKKIISNILLHGWIIVTFVMSACTDKLDIHQKYEFSLETMPVPKKLKKGETVEIRCRLIRQGKYSETKYYIRYFQPDGKGILKLGNLEFQPNDLYPLHEEIFRLYYTSLCTDQQSLDVYIEDNFGQVIKENFSFTNYTEE